MHSMEPENSGINICITQCDSFRINDMFSLLKATSFKLKFHLHILWRVYYSYMTNSIQPFNYFAYDAHPPEIIVSIVFFFYNSTSALLTLCNRYTAIMNYFKLKSLSLTSAVSMPFRHFTTSEARHW